MIRIENTEIFGKVIADAVVTVDTRQDIQTWEKARCINAIAKASARMQDNAYAPFMEFDGEADTLLIWNTETNKIYTVTANGCQCAAAENNNFCWHRAAKRLYEIYLPLVLKDAFERKEIQDANRRRFEDAGLFPSVLHTEVSIMEAQS